MKNKIRIVVSSPENVNNEVNKVRESVSGIVLVNSHPPPSFLLNFRNSSLTQGRSAELLLQEYPELAADHQVRLIYFQVRLIQSLLSVVYFAFPRLFYFCSPSSQRTCKRREKISRFGRIALVKLNQILIRLVRDHNTLIRDHNTQHIQVMMYKTQIFRLRERRKKN